MEQNIKNKEHLLADIETYKLGLIRQETLLQHFRFELERVGEMVTTIKSNINKLNEWIKQAEEQLAQLDKPQDTPETVQ